MSPQKLLTAFILSSGVLAASASAADAEKPFLALDYSIFTVEDSGFSIKPQAARLRAGTVLNQYLAVEAHAAAGIGGDNVSINVPPVVEVRTDIKSVYGVFLRPQVTLGTLQLYALAGVAYTNVQFSVPGIHVKMDQDDSDFAWGAGLQLDLGKHLGVSASYTKYLETVDSVSAGVVYRF